MPTPLSNPRTPGAFKESLGGALHAVAQDHADPSKTPGLQLVIVDAVAMCNATAFDVGRLLDLVAHRINSFR